MQPDRVDEGKNCDSLKTSEIAVWLLTSNLIAPNKVGATAPIFISIPDASPLHVRLGPTGHQRVNPGECDVAAAVAAPSGGFLTFDDGESGIDITNIVTAARRIGGINDAVEDEIQRIELRVQYQPTLLIPDEGASMRSGQSAGGAKICTTARGAELICAGFGSRLAGYHTLVARRASAATITTEMVVLPLCGFPPSPIYVLLVYSQKTASNGRGTR